MALLLVAALLSGCGVKENDDPKQTPGTKQAKAAEVAAELPELPAYPSEEDFTLKDGSIDYNKFGMAMNEWSESMRARRKEAGDAAKLLTSFYEKTLPIFLGAEDGANKVYSPFNVYLALAMLAEITSGETQAQILAVLGADDVETVREAAKLLWLSNYSSGDGFTCLLANSLWLNENINFNEDVLLTLAKEHFASSYSGKCGSEEMNKKLQTWLDENTGGLLKEQAQGVELSPETVIALASTIYYKATWTNKFEKSFNEQRTFYAAAEEIAEFMQTTEQMIYAKGENFTMVALPMVEGGYMYLLLPEEGTTPESLFANEEAMEAIRKGQTGEWARVHLVLPKFDVASSMDLVDGLSKLGMTDVFGDEGDFTALTEDTDVYVSGIQHAGRVKIDEEGVEAAAFTVIKAEGNAALVDEPIEVVLDRPFGFVIAGLDGTELFAGVVNSVK